ncbi:MAG: polyprenyl synthetase family protein [Bacillota bacterium]|nr:polyprenyl synthetase family protein [Bacillota bacterium]MDW7678300.1 polyprenyl synthetase family protein [Bacillota bacterium]
MEWREQLQRYVDLINEGLSVYTDVEDPESQQVVDAMQYSLFAGGKRLRPVLALAAAEMLGADSRAALPYACALEMIHTYSLIHDDLPAMDDDDFRRGKPSSHMVYGDGMAILAGDGLLNLAYEVMMEDALTQDDPRPYLKAAREIAVAAGIYGMIGGQTADLMNEGNAVTPDTLLYIHRHKTGALLAASLTAGAYAAGAGDAEAEALKRAGFALGLAFQIQDDLLDLEGDEEEMGKPAGSDLRNEKVTYPSLFGAEAAHDKVRELTEEALTILERFGPSSAFLQSLATYLITRRS